MVEIHFFADLVVVNHRTCGFWNDPGALAVTGNDAGEVGGPGLLYNFMIRGQQYFLIFKLKTVFIFPFLCSVLCFLILHFDLTRAAFKLFWFVWFWRALGTPELFSMFNKMNLNSSIREYFFFFFHHKKQFESHHEGKIGMKEEQKWSQEETVDR